MSSKMFNWMKNRCRRRSVPPSVGSIQCEGGITHDGHRLSASPMYFTLEGKDISSVSDTDLDDDIYEDVSDVTEQCAPRHSVFSNKEVDLKDKDSICPICRSEVVLGGACFCLDPKNKSLDVYFEIYAEPIYNRYVNGKQECTSSDDSSGYYESFASDSDSSDKQFISCNDSQNDVGHMTVHEGDDGYEEIEFKPNAINNKRRRYSLSSLPLTSSPRRILTVIRERRLSRTISRKGSLF